MLQIAFDNFHDELKFDADGPYTRLACLVLCQPYRPHVWLAWRRKVRFTPLPQAIDDD